MKFLEQTLTFEKTYKRPDGILTLTAIYKPISVTEYRKLQDGSFVSIEETQGAPREEQVEKTIREVFSKYVESISYRFVPDVGETIEESFDGNAGYDAIKEAFNITFLGELFSCIMPSTGQEEEKLRKNC